jgi:hypothetical protein
LHFVGDLSEGLWRRTERVRRQRSLEGRETQLCRATLAGAALGAPSRVGNGRVRRLHVRVSL